MEIWEYSLKRLFMRALTSQLRSMEPSRINQ